MPNALVTGGSEGIGRAIALALGRGGYQVGLCARTRSRVEQASKELGALGIRAVGVAADVSDATQVAEAVARITDTLGAIDVLVNNAGIAIIKPFDQLTLEDWDRTMATNLRGLFLVTGAVLPAMRQRKSGSIVNIASLAGRNGFAGGTAYAASKHGVLGFSRSLMLEVRQDDIRVIAICPGSVDTALIQSQEMLAKPGRKMLLPEDVAEVVMTSLTLPPRALLSELDLRPTNP